MAVDVGLFDRLFKQKPIIEADDPVFGHITYKRGVWTFIPRRPTNGFMITVPAPETGPTQSQRSHFQKIRSELPKLEQRARDFMRSRVEQNVDVSSLSVYSIEIGDDDQSRRESFVLEMCDESAHIIHRVSFIGSEPQDYGFDC